jgi:hypothetical protein
MSSNLLTDLSNFFQKHHILTNQRIATYLLLILSFLTLGSYFYSFLSLYSLLVSIFVIAAFFFERPQLGKTKEQKIADLQAKIEKIQNE